MDTGRVALGVLTNYNVFILLVRKGPGDIVMSSPVICDSTERSQLPQLDSRLANDMSVWQFLLSLLLYSGQPNRLTEKGGVWRELYVRPEEEHEAGKGAKKRKGEGGGKGKKKARDVSVAG
jgi:hypothetical protein